MADKVFSAEEWFGDVKGDIKLSDEQTQAMETLLANPDIAKNIGNSVLRQSDYSRQSDALKIKSEAAETANTEAERLRTEAAEFVTKQKDRAHNNLTLHEQLVKDLATANSRVDELGGEQVTSRIEPEVKEEPEVPMLTVKEYEAREAQRDAQTIQLSTRMITLANEHRSNFDEDFDPAPVVAHATEKGMTLDEAYTDLNAERFATKTEADIQARIDTAVRDNEIELRSMHDFPETVSGPTRVSGLDQPEESKLKTEDARVSATLQGLAALRAKQ